MERFTRHRAPQSSYAERVVSAPLVLVVRRKAARPRIDLASVLPLAFKFTSPSTVRIFKFRSLVLKHRNNSPKVSTIQKVQYAIDAQNPGTK